MDYPMRAHSVAETEDVRRIKAATDQIRFTQCVPSVTDSEFTLKPSVNLKRLKFPSFPELTKVWTKPAS